jgi:hypothetical protein
VNFSTQILSLASQLHLSQLELVDVIGQLQELTPRSAWGIVDENARETGRTHYCGPVVVLSTLSIWGKHATLVSWTVGCFRFRILSGRKQETRKVYHCPLAHSPGIAWQYYCLNQANQPTELAPL